MSHRSLTILLVLIVVIVAGVLEPLTAGQRVASVASSPVRRSSANAAGATTSVITGQVLRADSRTPVVFARVRLRNLDNGAIIEKTSADHLGEFSFLVVSRGNYVAELLDNVDRVLAAGEALTLEAGQSVGTLILLPAQAPSLAGLFGNSAAAIVSAAAGMGITAVAATGQPLSPEK